MRDAEHREKFRKHYASLMDEELVELASEGGELTEVAGEALRAEIGRRGLSVRVAESRPTTKHPEWRKPMTVRTFRDLPEAQLARSILESASIPCYLADENIIGLDWFYSNAVGGIKLWVNEEDLPAARALLNAEIPENFEVEGLGEFRQPRCPDCDSLDVSYEDLNKRATYAAFFLKLPIPIHARKWKCYACGHEWKGEPDGARPNATPDSDQQ